MLTHEAIVDSLWDASIQKLLLKRFPAATPEDLEKAHAFAYGGCIIQDMGYYPFSSHLFSDLTHYVRSGDFIVALIRESQDLDEYAFALGALAHYAADNNGHRIATNLAVPILYPKLRRKFGKDRDLLGQSAVAHPDRVRLRRLAGRARAIRHRTAIVTFIGFQVSQAGTGARVPGYLRHRDEGCLRESGSRAGNLPVQRRLDHPGHDASGMATQEGPRSSRKFPA